MKINKNTRCLVTGAKGFLGRHLSEKLKNKCKLYIVKSNNTDLRNYDQAKKIFKEIKPQIVFNLAAKVGGILDNKKYPADYFYDNLSIINNVFKLSSDFKVEKIVNVGAGCGYPLDSKEPLEEKSIFNGLPQKESIAYSMVKKMIIIANKAYLDQYNLKSNVIIPSNLYGEYDNFNLESSHVIPALVRKFYEAKIKNKKYVEVWGTGSAKRDFVYAGDVADSLIYLCENYREIDPINICSGNQVSIKSVAMKLKKISKFKGQIVFNKNMPEGQSSRKFSTKKIKKIMKKKYFKFLNINDGLERTYEWFEKNYKIKKKIRL